MPNWSWTDCHSGLYKYNIYLQLLLEWIEEWSVLQDTHVCVCNYAGLGMMGCYWVKPKPEDGAMERWGWLEKGWKVF